MSERNLRDLLADAAADIPAFAPAPEVVVPRARRRAAVSIGISALALVVVVTTAAPLISRLTASVERPASGPVATYPIEEPAMPMSTIAAYGSVWTVEQAPLGPDVGDGMGWADELVARDIETGDVRFRVPLGDDAGGQLVQLRAGFGAVWTLSSSRKELTKVDPDTGQIVWRRNIAASGFDVGSGGVWTITSTGEAQKIGADSGSVRTATVVGEKPIGIAVTYGAIWIVDDFDGVIRRVDPFTEEVVAEIPTGTNLTGDIVADSRGAWTIGCRAIDGSDDPRALLDQCDLVLITIDPSTNTVAHETPLAGPASASMTLDRFATAEAVDDAGVWVVLSEAACGASAFAPCDGDALLRFAHDGVSLLDRTDRFVITDVTSTEGDLWIANIGEAHEIVRWEP